MESLWKYFQFGKIFALCPGEDGLVPGPGLCAAGDAADQPGQRGGRHHRHLQQARGGHLGTQLLCVYLNISKYVLSMKVVAFLRRRGSVCWAATELSPRPLLLWRRRRKIVPVNKDQEMINNVKQWWVHAFWKYINHMWTKMWTRYTCHVWVMMWVSGVSQNTVNHYIRTLVCRGLSVRHCQFINCKYLSLI